jgi:hypothetical protein
VTTKGQQQTFLPCVPESFERRQVAGATPKAFLKARENAASESSHPPSGGCDGCFRQDRRSKMNAIDKITSSERYERCVETSKRVRWDIDKDVIRGRRFDAADKFLPDGLSLTDSFTTLSADEKRFVSHIQGRTYANVFGLVERFIKRLAPGYH